MSSDELNVVKYKREMEQMINKNILNLKRLNEILAHLHELNVDLPCLQRTKIGVCVNNVRKTFKSNEQISSKTADLIRKWKKVAKEEFNVNKSNDETKNNLSPNSLENNGHSSKSKNDDSASETSEASTSTSNVDFGNSRSHVTDVIHESVDHEYSSRAHSENKKRKSSDFDFDHPEFLDAKHKSLQASSRKKQKIEEKLEPTVDDIRQKSVNLLFEALKFEQVDHNAQHLAEQVEAIIFEDCGRDVSSKHYKAKIRSRVMNLRDKNNPDLVKNIILGRIKAEQFARMTVEEMASEQMKTLRKSIEDESILERQSKAPESTGLAKSDMFPCPQCSQRDACYTISQDRVDGEYDPVSVTSLFCNQCGHSWKIY